MTTPSEESTVLTQISEILADVAGVDRESITPESRLTEDLAVSSVNLIEAIVRVEEEFGTRIEDDDVKDFRTVSDVMNFINARKGG